MFTPQDWGGDSVASVAAGEKTLASTVLGDIVKRRQALEPSAHVSQREHLDGGIRTCKNLLKLLDRLQTTDQVGHIPLEVKADGNCEAWSPLAFACGQPHLMRTRLLDPDPKMLSDLKEIKQEICQSWQKRARDVFWQHASRIFEPEEDMPPPSPCTPKHSAKANPCRSDCDIDLFGTPPGGDLQVPVRPRRISKGSG